MTQLESNPGWLAGVKGSWRANLGSWRPGRYDVTPANLTAQNSFSATEGTFQGPTCTPLVPDVIGHAVQELTVQMRPELESWVPFSYPHPEPLEFRLATNLDRSKPAACDWYICSSRDESTYTAINGGKLSVQGTMYLHTKTNAARGERGCTLLLAE